MAEQKEAVKRRPAGINDNFTIVGADINNIVEKGQYKLNAIPAPKVEVLSIDLKEGSTIKVYNGGIKSIQKGMDK